MRCPEPGAPSLRRPLRSQPRNMCRPGPVRQPLHIDRFQSRAAGPRPGSRERSHLPRDARLLACPPPCSGSRVFPQRGGAGARRPVGVLAPAPVAMRQVHPSPAARRRSCRPRRSDRWTRLEIGGGDRSHEEAIVLTRSCSLRPPPRTKARTRQGSAPDRISMPRRGGLAHLGAARRGSSSAVSTAATHLGWWRAAQSSRTQPRVMPLREWRVFGKISVR